MGAVGADPPQDVAVEPGGAAVGGRDEPGGRASDRDRRVLEPDVGQLHRVAPGEGCSVGKGTGQTLMIVSEEGARFRWELVAETAE